MKRQNSTKISSSSCRENANSSSSETDPHARSTGCLSSIVQLVCKYQSRRKFLITSGKKPEKNTVSAKESTESSPTKSAERRDAQNDVILRTPDEQPRPRLSCEAAARSPTIPPEIRCSDKSKDTTFRSSATQTPSLMARLMGLSGETTAVSSESAAEKRQKLLGALEKCDRDLKALKKFIDAVRSAELARQGPDPTAGADGKNGGGSDQEQPSPVSVLDGLTQSPSLTRCMKRQPNVNGAGRLQHHPQVKTVVELDGTDHSPVISLSERINFNIPESLPPSARRLSISSPPSPADRCIDQHHGSHCEAFYADIARLKMVIGRGMRESVEQVCKDLEWGERREAGRIGLALQDHICRDLIEETVKELGLFCNYATPVAPLRVESLVYNGYTML